MCNAQVTANPNSGADNVTRQPERKVQKSGSTENRIVKNNKLDNEQQTNLDI
jgi:hypothetical protein